MKRIAFAILALTWACEGKSGINKWPEPAAIPLIVHVALPEDSVISTPVSMVPVPDVGYGALVYPDPNHIKVVLSPGSGTVDRIEPSGHLEAGTVAASVRGNNGQARRVELPGEGVWRPRRQAGQVILQGDTLGLLVEHGYWLAVGQVSDIEYGALHQGDIALVSLQRRGSPVPGHVETIAPPGGTHPWYAEVSVEFSASEDFFPSGANFAHVEVTPLAASDSIVSVPRTAVVGLGAGPAVFVPTTQGAFEVHWVLTGRNMGDRTIVRSGLDRNARVVTIGLDRLALAARDSLSSRVQASSRKK